MNGGGRSLSDFLLIGNGFLGKKIHSLCRDSYKIKTADISDGNDFFLDITNAEQCLKVIRKAGPQTIILTASLAGVDYCERHKKEAFSVNAGGPANIAGAIKEINPEIKLVYFSTDYAFDGKKGNYNENDRANPLGVYAKSKVKGERESIKADDFLILRVSTLYGFNSPDDKRTYTKMIIENLSLREKVLAGKQVTSPTFIDDVANATIKLIEKKECGIFHVAGPKAFSRFDWAHKVAWAFGLDETLIEEIESIPGQVAPRPKDASLNIGKLKAKGIKMDSSTKSLLLMKEQMEKGGVI